MKLHKIVKAIGMLVISALFASCSSYLRPNPGNPAISEINKTMQNSYANNKLIDQKITKMKIPYDVNKALLPALTVEKTDQIAKMGKRFNISVKGVSARSFLMGLVKDTDYNIIVSPKIAGVITLDLKNVTIEDILEVLHDTYGYQFRRTNYGYEVLPKGLETRVFTFNYLNVDRSGQSHTSISSGQISQKVTGGGGDENGGSRYKESVPSSSVDTNASSNFWETLNTTLTTIVGTQGGRQVIINPQAGMVLVKAFPDELNKVANYLDSLQSTMTRQVILEAKILEVQLNNDFQAGIDWKVLGLQQRGDIILPGLTETDIRETYSHIFRLSASDGSQFNTVIDLLSTQGNVQILSSPRISTLNNQKAVIKVGRDEFFITNISSTTVSGGTTTDQTQDVDFTPFFSGISLDVTPEIDAKGNVILHIHPFISTVIDQKKEYKINDQDQSIPLALSDIRESDNVVYAKDGQVVVIGGLIENETEENIGSTPGVSNIPILGSLFRKTDQKSKKSELVILIRPTVVKNSTWSKQISKTTNNFRKLDKGFHFGDNPNTFGNLGEWDRK